MAKVNAKITFVIVWGLFDVLYQAPEVLTGVFKFVHECSPLNWLKFLIDHLIPDPSRSFRS